MKNLTFRGGIQEKPMYLGDYKYTTVQYGLDSFQMQGGTWQERRGGWCF